MPTFPPSLHLIHFAFVGEERAAEAGGDGDGVEGVCVGAGGDPGGGGAEGGGARGGEDPREEEPQDEHERGGRPNHIGGEEPSGTDIIFLKHAAAFSDSHPTTEVVTP